MVQGSGFGFELSPMLPDRGFRDLGDRCHIRGLGDFEDRRFEGSWAKLFGRRQPSTPRISQNGESRSGSRRTNTRSLARVLWPIVERALSWRRSKEELPAVLAKSLGLAQGRAGLELGGLDLVVRWSEAVACHWANQHTGRSLGGRGDAGHRTGLESLRTATFSLFPRFTLPCTGRSR